MFIDVFDIYQPTQSLHKAYMKPTYSLHDFYMVST